MNAVPTLPTLAWVVRGFRADVLGIDELRVAFRDSTVFCERAARPGFLALGRCGAGVVPVFTSPLQLALARGPVGWFAMSGGELPGLLAGGYDILIDLAAADALLLHPGALCGHGADRRADGAAGRLGPADGVLAGPVAEATAAVCYDQSHDVEFRTGPDTWEAWVARAPGRALGEVSRSMVLSAVSAVSAAWPAGRDGPGRTRIHADHRGTAVALLGLTTGELRRRYSIDLSEGDIGPD